MCEFRFSDHVRLFVISFDDVLILTGAVSTPVDDGPYFFNVGSWLVNLRTIWCLFLIGESPFILLVLFQFGCFNFFQWKLSSSVHQKYVFWSNNILCKSRGTLECYLSQTCIHAMIDSSSIRSEGSALQCIFITICYGLLVALP